MNKLSVIINTLDEEKNIVDCIKSVKKMADEIIVVDMESDDNTRKLAKKAGAKIYKHKRMGYVEPARNFAINKAKNDWIFIIDADERVTKKLAKRIKSAITREEISYYTIPRKNIIFGKWIQHTGWWPDYNIRLFRKAFVEWDNEIHSVPITKGQGADFEPKEENAIVHYNYLNLEDYISRLNRYTSIQAKEKYSQDKEFNWKNVISSPTKEFVSRYFSQQGYKDGLHGLALSLLQSFSELVVELKIWQETKFSEKDIDAQTVIKKIRETQREISYWNADTLVKESGNLVEKLRRKFKI